MTVQPPHRRPSPREGKNAGTHTALVLTGDAGRDGKYDVQPELVADDLLTAVNTMLEGTR